MSYAINEIFYSIQGEGIRAGEASFFVRFAGCNQKCSVQTHGFDCDTEYVSSRRMELDDILKAVTPSQCKWVVLTGGEPGLQIDFKLVEALQKEGIQVAIETNGSIDVSLFNLDWITVSPKVAEHAIRQKTATEVKYVRGVGQGIPKPACKAKYKLISPATRGQFVDQLALDWCIGLVKDHPDWRLSVQQHKLWGVR